MGFATITDEAIAELRSRIGKPIKRVTAPFYREINVEGTRKLLEAAVDAGVRRFVHTSTVGVHGDVKQGFPASRQ